MNTMEYRRRMLFSQLGINKFIIFLDELLAGEIIENVDSDIYSERINVKGHEKYDSGRAFADYFKYAVDASGNIRYDVPMNTKSSLESAYEARGYTQSASGEPWTFYVIDPGSGAQGESNTWRVYYYGYPKTWKYPGHIIIGHYDFTKYKKLKFTVDKYEGSGSISFGDNIEEVSAAGEYSIDIKECEGIFDIKFRSDSSTGFAVNNVYLEG
jgi:hypothetical protein